MQTDNYKNELIQKVQKVGNGFVWELLPNRVFKSLTAVKSYIRLSKEAKKLIDEAV